MQGYLVTFFTQQNRTHNGTQLARWLVDQAQQLGISGATLFSGKAGFGHDGRFHSENYFDLEDPPLQVAMALRPDECERLMNRLDVENVRIFFTKSEIEFGFTSER